MRNHKSRWKARLRHAWLDLRCAQAVKWLREFRWEYKRSGHLGVAHQQREGGNS